jgi:predicted outer membrane repeat protein
VIQAAVDDAVSGDTIQIAAGTYSDCVVFVVDISGKNLTIDGAGQNATFIDPMQLCAGVRISNGDLVMSDLTVRNGSSAGSGVGVTVQGAGSDLDLTDVTVKDNTSTTASAAGIVVVTGTTADLLRVVVSGNSADIDGGGMDVWATAVATVTDSQFTLNDAGGNGGAINIGAATVTIDNTTFDTNTAGDQGGAIRFSSSSGNTLAITDSAFTGNEAATDGGGVYVALGNLTVERSLFTGNTAASDGGGLGHEFTETATDLLRVVNSTFFDNEATAGDGGGAYADGFFINTTFSGNSAGDDGGGLARNGFSTVNAANSIFAGNTAGDAGPDCYGVWSEGHNLVQSDASYPNGDCIVGVSDLAGNAIGVNPYLLPLADNGGPTMTMALPLGSAARNAGNPDVADPTDWDSYLDEAAGDWSCALTDQRATDRDDGRCDIGAYEVDRVIRYAGADRYATAAAISEGHFPGGSTVVLIATGLNYPDALAGAAWANILGWPLLLVNSSEVPAATAAELTRLDPDLITILGGPGAVPDSVKTTLESYATSVTRVFGATRYDTAIAISQASFPDGTAQAVLIATGLNFPDALAAAATADILNAPLLLVPGNAADLPQSVADEIVRIGADTIVVVGGTGAVSAGIYDDLDNLQGGDTITRLSGADRYETAIALSQYAFGSGADLAYIATGLNFPDALTGAAAAINSPILLVPGADSTVPAVVEAELIALGAAADGTAIILGGTGVISAAMQTDLNTIFAT